MVYWKFCWIRKEHIGRTWMIWGYLPWLWNPPYGNMRSEDVGILVDRRYWSWYSTIITWCDMIWCDVTWHDWSYIMWFESKGYIVGVELYLQSWGYPMIHAKKHIHKIYAAYAGRMTLPNWRAFYHGIHGHRPSMAIPGTQIVSIPPGLSPGQTFTVQQHAIPVPVVQAQVVEAKVVQVDDDA